MLDTALTAWEVDGFAPSARKEPFMRTSLWVGLAFIVGVVLACAAKEAVEPQRATAEQPSAKWEHKAFQLYQTSGGTTPLVEDVNKTLAAIDAERWEYAFSLQPVANRNLLVFKRKK